jgi:hypothetical protein
MDLEKLQASSTMTRRGKPRQRSAIACARCHARRIKCDAVANGLPCSTCTRGGQSCQLIESKRHGQKKKENKSSAAAFRSPNPPSTALVESRHLGALLNSSPTGGHASLDRENVNTQQQPNDDPENLYTRLLEDAASPVQRPDKIKSPTQIMYLGETFNLTHLVHQTSPSRPKYLRKLHYALPVKPKDELSSPCYDTANSELLRLQKAFDVPPIEVCHELFRVYFNCVHPHYPILDHLDFSIQYQNPSNPPSYLLLQSVLFMSAGHCPESLILDAGFTSRYEARLTLFKRAKALYDTEYESDQVTIVQSLFLMSFWWNSLTDQKDTWHWLGNSISLALTLGMHRSTRYSDLCAKDQRLWKRIWWSLFIEDKHAAAALGRPVHIRLRDCDIEPLDESDFEEHSSSEAYVFGIQENVHVTYVIFLCELSKILERIVEKSFNRQQKVSSSIIEKFQECQAMLRGWEALLPAELRFRPSCDCLWTNNLHIAYRLVTFGIVFPELGLSSGSWFQILTYRSFCPNDATNLALAEESQQIAMKAAGQIVRIVEDLISSQKLKQCPIHFVPALFAAMGMHAIDICSGDSVREQLGNVKIRLSMIALRELKSTWPVSKWVFLLFSKVVRQIRDQGDLSLQEEPSNDFRGKPSLAVNADFNSPRRTHLVQSTSNISQHQRTQVSLAGPVGGDLSNSFLPFNFPADWNSAVDDSLWSYQDLDFWMTPLT